MRRFPSITLNLIALTLAAIGTSEPVVAQQVSGAIGIHDPSSVIEDGSMYFLYGTGDGILNKWSSDGLDWHDESTGVFLSPPAWTTEAVPSFTGFFWAPDIAYFNGLYHLYYSVSSWGTIDSAIGVATSPTLNRNSLNYGWTDQGKVVQSDAAWEAGPDTDTTSFNAIDPSILLASDGRLWMSFGSYSSGILVTQLAPSTGKRLSTSTLDATLVANNAPGGGWGSSIEGSALVEEDGYYYLFVNYGGCCSGVDSTYDVRVGRSTNPTGPFLDKDGVDMRDGGGSLFLDDNGKYIGPGHFARFTDTDGTDYFGYHYYNGDAVGAPTYNKERLYWTADGWPSAAAVNPDWRGTLNEDWGQSSNWWDGVVPDGVGAVANFGARSASRSYVTLEENRTVGTVNFHSGGPDFTVRAAGFVLTLDADPGESATINVNSGNQTIDAPISAVDQLGVNVITSARLNLGDVSGTGLTKYGHGTLAMNGTSTFSHAVLVKWGTLEVNSSITASQFTSIGHVAGESAVMTLIGTGSYTTTADFNVGDTGNNVDPASGTLNIHDNATIAINSGGLFVGAGYFSNTKASGTVNQTGGTVEVTNSADGFFTVGGRNSSLAQGTYNLSGGTVNADTSVRIGGMGSGTLNVSGSGELNTSKPLYLGFASTGQGTVNLSGGTLTVPSIRTGSGTGTLNLNGGVLRAGARSGAFLEGALTAYIQAGGAVFDTQASSVTNGQPLLHYPALGATPDGGLTKRGTGLLRLTGASTYTGATRIENGTLALSGSGSIAQSPLIRVESGTFDVSGLASPFTLGGSQSLENHGTVVGNVVAGGGSLIAGNGAFTHDVVAQSGATLRVSGGASAPPTLSITNGDFEAGIVPPGDFDVDFWFDTNTTAGASDWWANTQHEQGLSPTADTGVLLGDGNGAIGGATGVGGRWMYQQIGTVAAGDSYNISFDYGPDLNADSNRAVAIRVDVFQGTFAAAADDNDIADEGLNLITTIDAPPTSLFGEGNYASFSSALDLSTANTTEPLWLRIANLPGTGSNPGSWVVIDHVELERTMAADVAGETMTVQGDFELQLGATVELDLAMNDYDTISIDRSAILDGVLAVSLAPGFTPNLNDTFTVLTASSITNNLTLGGPDGSLFSLAASTPTDLILTAVSGLAGDYNNDGVVDAADYTVWRDALAVGTISLLNDATPSTVDESDFTSWKNNFGATLGSGSGTGSSLANVPEPATFVLLLGASVVLARRRRTRAW